MDIPPEIIREILSFRSIPSGARVSRDMQDIEKSLHEERVENIKRKYTNTRGSLSVDVAKDPDALSFVMRYRDEFNISLMTMHRYFHALGQNNLKYVVDHVLSEPQSRMYVTAIVVGAIAGENYGLVTYMFNKYNDMIDYQEAARSAVYHGEYGIFEWILRKADEDGQVIEYLGLLPVALRYPNMDILGVITGRIQRDINDLQNGSSSDSLTAAVMRDNLIDILEESLVVNYDKYETIQYVDNYMSNVLYERIGMNTLFDMAMKTLENSDSPGMLEVIVDMGLQDSYITHNGIHIYSTHDELADMAMDLGRCNSLAYLIDLGVSPESLYDRIDHNTPACSIDIITSYLNSD